MVDLPTPGAFDDEHGAELEVDDLPAIPAPAANPNTRATKRFGDVELGDELEADDLPIIAGATRPPSFGEISGFGEVDLPAVTGPRPDSDLPSAVSSAGLPAALGHLTRPRPTGEAFGEIDLPLLTKPRPVELDDELPSPFQSQPRRDGSFGEIDLPLVGSSDLPVSAEDALPVVGDYALPVAASALPVAVGASALPSPAGSALPSALGGASLPSAIAGGALPIAAGGGALPSPVAGGALPLALGGGTLPTAVQGGGLPSAMGGGSLPSAMGGGALPTAMAGGSLPSAMQGGGLPAAAPYGALPSVSGGVGLPVRTDGTALPSSREADFGELEQDLGQRAPGANPYDDSDRTAGGAMAGEVDLEGGAPRGQIGDEADLAAAPGEQGPRSMRHAPAGDAQPVKRSPALKIALAAIVVVGIGGGALALVPSIGPFGVNFIDDQIHASSYAQQLDELRARADAALDEDTAGAAGRAVDEVKQAHAARPRHQRTAAFAAYVTLARSIRFGKRGEDEAYAKQALVDAGPEPSPEKALAEAALAVYADASKGAGAADAAAKANAKDLDLAALAGEAALASKAKGAREVWKRAVAIKATARTLYGLARAAKIDGDFAAAKDAATKAVAASPLHAGARTLLAEIAWTQDNDEAHAVEHLKKVVDDAKVRGAASDAERVAALTWLGRIHLARSRASAAETAFSQALKIDPQAVDALVGEGELFYRAGRYSEALARFEGASRAEAGNIVAKVGIARSYLALERMKEAKDLLKATAAAAPKSALVALWFGRAEEALGNRKEAEADYKTAIANGGESSESVDAYVSLAHLLSINGRSEEAAAKLAEASEKFPELPALHRAKGEVALQAGQYEDAMKELSAALEKEDDLGTRFHYGVALRRLRRFAEAGEAFDKVGAADKDFPGLALERGLLFEDMGQTEKALEMYDAALKKAPQSVDLKLRVGSTQVIAGHGDQAEKILREVIKERPSSAEVNHFLGRAILLRGGNQAEAQRFLQKAVDFDPFRAEYHLYLGWIANDAGNIGLAEMELKKALELDHDLGDAYWQRGVLLQKQGQTVDALAALTTALEKKPTRYEAYASMALCYQDQLKWPEAEQAWRKAIAGDEAVPEWHYRFGKLLFAHGDRGAAAQEL
ncbi:MAG TPA: tetratricopeptide repeat protein, partial [Byssovorax sp.]